jgi:hypothetical protein
MAVQSQHNYLEMDGIAVEVHYLENGLIVYHDGEEVIRLEKN